MGLVYSVSRRYKHQMFPLEDAVQEGCRGLLSALDKFDTECEIQFSTYSYYWIRQSCARAMQEQSALIRVPIYMQTRLCNSTRDTPNMMRALACRYVRSIDYKAFNSRSFLDLTSSAVADDTDILLEELLSATLEESEFKLVTRHFKIDKETEPKKTKTFYRNVHKAIQKLRVAARQTKYEDLRKYIE